MEFAFSQTAFWLLLATFIGFFFLLCRKKKQTAPQLFYPDLEGLKQVAMGWRRRFGRLPRFLLYCSLGFFAAAFIDPRLLISRQGSVAAVPQSEPVEGIAIYLLLDQSGSMAAQIEVQNREGNREETPKIELLKNVTAAFVKGRPNDMIGIVALARGASVISPLTLDHQAILERILHLPVLSSPDQGGTVIGYGIYKTANLFAATRHFAEELKAYSIKSNVIILVTDGLQDPNPLDQNKALRNMEIPDAAAYAKQVGVKLYIVSIDPTLGAKKFEPARKQMQHAAESTGGKYYLVHGAMGLPDIYADIDKLEKSALPMLSVKQPDFYSTVFLFPALISMGLVLFFAALLLDTTLLKRIP